MAVEIVNSKRLSIIPISLVELACLAETIKGVSEEASQAYLEMFSNCKDHMEDYLWYTAWKILRTEDATVVGYAGFKGLKEDGSVEIGYGIHDGYENNGYATECVADLCKWAFSTNKVSRIEAETRPDDLAAQKVLLKNGFVKTETIGEKGPKFVKC